MVLMKPHAEDQLRAAVQFARAAGLSIIEIASICADEWEKSTGGQASATPEDE